MWSSQPDHARDWGIVDQGSRLLGKMQGYVQGHTPLETQRVCTDCLFIPLFVAAVLGFFLCISEAVEKGSFQRLTSLPDFEGNLCGTNGQGPYLYFCREQGIGLDLQHQICLEKCPIDSSSQIFCRGTGSTQMSYPTHSLAGMICMPTTSDLASEIKQVFNNNPFVKTLFDAMQVTYDWEQLVVAAIVASVLSYFYIFCISLCANCLVWLCLLALVTIPTCLGLVYVYMSASPEIVVPNSIPGTITTGDTQNDLSFGLALCGIGILLACVAVFKARTIKLALSSIEEAADCIRQMPVLSIQPWISSAVTLLVFIPGVLGFLMLNMSGDLPKQVDLTSGQPVYSGDPLVAISLIYYLVIFIWILELLHAISQFVVMFTAQVWYFRMKGRDDSFWSQFSGYDMLYGYLYAVTYHLGSLLYGSFLCTIFRVLRMLAAMLVRASEETGNPVAQCFLKCFTCCLACAEKLVRSVTSLSYCDVAMNSTTYCEGAEHAFRLVQRNGGALVAVEGLAMVFSFVGIGVVSASTAATCWMMSNTFDRYSNPMSNHYVPDKQMMIFLHALIGAAIAIPFMHLFDSICDAIVYCNAAVSFQLPSSWGSSGGLFGWFSGH